MSNFVWQNIICLFRIPHAIVTGKQFDNTKFKEICSHLGIKNFFSSPSHPQTNDQVVAINNIIKTILKTKLDEHKSA